MCVCVCVCMCMYDVCVCVERREREEPGSHLKLETDPRSDRASTQNWLDRLRELNTKIKTNSYIQICGVVIHVQFTVTNRRQALTI